MTVEQRNSESSFEFNIQEGAYSEHHEILNSGDSLNWSASADYGYDIEFSILVRSRLNGYKGTWVVFEKEKIINRDGYINASDLQDDGIKLPVSVEFRMDNSYSWFNPKRVYLNIKRELEVPIAGDPNPSDSKITLPLVRKNVLGDGITDESLRRMREGKARVDLLWLSHIVGEALMRVPDTVPEVRVKLSEIKELLAPHVQSKLNQAVL